MNDGAAFSCVSFNLVFDMEVAFVVEEQLENR